jgi:hypothetical protein
MFESDVVPQSWMLYVQTGNVIMSQQMPLEYSSE